MGVKEELEALRNRGVAKKNASKLQNASGLSTPEAEENAIKAEQQRTRVGNYGKDADQNLKSYNEAKIAVAGKNGVAIPPPSPSKDSVKVDEEAPAATAVDDEEVPTLEELPDMEEIPAVDAAVGSPAVAAPINRAERKARRMMEKLGMKAVPGISQVVLKMRGGGSRGGVFTIAAPDVFEKNGAYVVFGEARQGGGAGATTQAQQAQAIQQLAALAKADGNGVEMPAADSAPSVEEPTETAVDETGLEAKDIDLVVTQASCSRAKAIQALRDNDGDLVNAIMSLTA